LLFRLFQLLLQVNSLISSRFHASADANLLLSLTHEHFRRIFLIQSKFIRREKAALTPYIRALFLAAVRGGEMLAPTLWLLQSRFSLALKCSE